MTAIKKAMKKQSVELTLKGVDVSAFAVIPGSRTILAVIGNSQIAWMDEKMQMKTYKLIHKNDDDLKLAALKALSHDALMGADINSARQYALEGDQFVETNAWDLLSDQATTVQN